MLLQPATSAIRQLSNPLFFFVPEPLLRNLFLLVKGKGKGKVLPRTGREGPEGEQIYRSTLSSNSALDGGGWSVPRPGRFTPWKDVLNMNVEAVGTVFLVLISRAKFSNIAVV